MPLMTITITYIFTVPDKFITFKRIRHFTLRNFSWNFWNWHLYIYKKHDTLCYVTFLYTEIDTFRKKKDNLRYFFIIQKACHFALRNFHGIFEIGGGGVGIFINKNNVLCIKRSYARNNALSVTFYIQFFWYFASYFYMQRTVHFVLLIYI